MYFFDIIKNASVISWTLESSGARFSKPHQQLIVIFHRLGCDLCFNLGRLCVSDPLLNIKEMLAPLSSLGRCEDT